MKKVFQKIRSQDHILTEEDVRFLLEERYDECRMLPVILGYEGGGRLGEMDARCIVMMKDLAHLMRALRAEGNNRIITIQVGGTKEMVGYWKKLGYNSKKS